jgi:hypothetical protein
MERPILFSGPMVRAILDGRKTQTRRAFNDKAKWHFLEGHGDLSICPYGVPGDRLWVRETWMDLRGTGIEPYTAAPTHYAYAADSPPGSYSDQCRKDFGLKWRPSIHMPRVASRLTLEVVNVRVERLQEISEEDAKAEGCEARPSGTWWQGYKEFAGDLIHQQWKGDAPPEWMIEHKRMKPTPHLDRSAKDAFETLWNAINSERAPWASNPWVWVVEFAPRKGEG